MAHLAAAEMFNLPPDFVMSGDWYGVGVVAEGDIDGALAELIDENVIEIMYGDYHPNPHIKAFSGLDKKEQIPKLKKIIHLFQMTIIVLGLWLFL